MSEAAATVDRHPGSTQLLGVTNGKFAMWIFLASECLFFGALLSTYLIFKGDLSLPPFPNDTVIAATEPRERSISVRPSSK